MSSVAQPIRPKVFRPPVTAKRKATLRLKRHLAGYAPYLVFGGLFFMLAMSSAPANKMEGARMGFTTGVAKRLPTISITSDLVENNTLTTLAMNQPPEDLPASLSDGITRESSLRPSRKMAKTIILKGNSGTIVGQMARIPLENEQITEIKPLQDIDNIAGRELLSIINKY